MIKISIPNNFEIEREYVVEIIFKWILNLPYEISHGNFSNTLIELPNKNSIEIVDGLFTKLNDNDSFINQISSLIKVSNISNEFCKEKEIPVLFGSDLLNRNEQSGIKNYVLHADILASAFFTLARIEEYQDIPKDKNDRASAYDSHAYKNNYLHRPVVNEYAEMLWNILLHLGADESMRKRSEYKIIPTHDIDKVYYKRLQFFLGDIIIDKNISRAVKRISLPNQNYWDTFSWMMDVSEENNLQSIFYMMADSDNKLDSKYSLTDSFIKTKINEIKSRGHKIGFHPGYDTIDNFEEWNRQKELLENSIGQKIEETRQHFLRFNFPETINIIEKAGVKVDSTLSYPDQIGFRCGTSSEFPLFDLVNRRVTNVIERPLIIMDIILRDRKNTEASAEKAIETFESYKETCKKYQIPLTILFHNSSFDPIRWNTWKEAYRNHFLK